MLKERNAFLIDIEYLSTIMKSKHHLSSGVTFDTDIAVLGTNCSNELI